jgi:hypothetical protein
MIQPAEVYCTEYRKRLHAAHGCVVKSAKSQLANKCTCYNRKEVTNVESHDRQHAVHLLASAPVMS